MSLFLLYLIVMTSLILKSKSLIRNHIKVFHKLSKRSLFTGEIESNLGINDNEPKIGTYCSVIHEFPQEDVNTFSTICGDNNPLHINPEYAQTTMFKGPIVHGILVSSLFSTLFGRRIKGSIYVSQSLEFKRPVYVGDRIKAHMEVIKKEDRKKGALLTCSTTIYFHNDDNNHSDNNDSSGDNIDSNSKVAVTGTAQVLLPRSS